MREDNTQAKIFIGVTAVIFVINLVGILYGFYADAQYEQAKQLIQEAYNQEYENGIEEFIANCEKGAKILWQAIAVFGIQILVGALITIVLSFPQKIYKVLKIDILKYLQPNDTYQVIVEIVIFLMLLWNIVSPILDIGDFMDLHKELCDVITKLGVEEFIKDISTF